MTDLNSLLSEASRLAVPPTTPEQIDADIARGRRMLQRRRARRLGTGAGIVGALVLAAVVVVPTVGRTGHPATTADPAVTNPVPANPDHTAPEQKKTPAGPAAQPAIELVAYTGEQAPGYTVDKVPEKWVLQGANSSALVIAKPDNPNKDLNFWFGKLVVMLASNDETAPTSGTKVMVGKNPGIIRHEDPTTAQLFFTDAHGHSVDIQAPAALHWSDAQLTDFAAGVHVNANAVAGNG